MHLSQKWNKKSNALALALLLSCSALGACSSMDDQKFAYASHRYPLTSQETYLSTSYRSPPISPPVKSGWRAAVGYMDQNDRIPSGRNVSAPTGFLEMCSRSPVDCQSKGGEDLELIRAAARDALVQKVNIALGRSPNIEAGKYVDQDGGNLSWSYVSDSTPSHFNAGTMYLTWPGSELSINERPLDVATSTSMTEKLNRVSPPNAATARQTSFMSHNFFDQSAYKTVPAESWSAPPLGSTEMQPAAPPRKWVRYQSHLDRYSDAAPGAVPDEPRRLTWGSKVENLGAPQPSTQFSGPRSENERTYRDYSSQAKATSVASPAAIEFEQPVFNYPSGQTPGSASHTAWTGNVFRSDNRAVLDVAQMPLLQRVNDLVNRTLKSDTDADIYHVPDYWTAPGLRLGQRADCEDYVLQKRRELIRQGVPAAAMSIAIVRTRRDEDHAVLLVSTTAGDYVLDNMSYRIKIWRDADYVWVSRQSGDSLSWVSLDSANIPLTQDIRSIRVAYAP